MNELYDPINDAPLARFDDSQDRYSGIKVKFEWRDNDGSERIPAFTLRLDKPTDEGDEYAIILARSKQMQKAIGRAMDRAGRTDLGDGLNADWMSVWFIEERQPIGGGNKYKLYDADYKLGDVPDDGSVERGGLEADPDASPVW